MADTRMHGGQAADDMTRGGGRMGRGEASGERTTRQEGGGVGRRKASGRRTTQQEGHCRGGRRWWNPPMRVSADVEAATAAVTAAAAVGCRGWSVGGYRRMSGMAGGASNWTGRQVLS